MIYKEGRRHLERAVSALYNLSLSTEVRIQVENDLMIGTANSEGPHRSRLGNLLQRFLDDPSSIEPEEIEEAMDSQQAEEPAHA